MSIIMSKALDRRKKIIELAVAGHDRIEIATKVECSLGAVNRVFRSLSSWTEDKNFLEQLKK